MTAQLNERNKRGLQYAVDNGELMAYYILPSERELHEAASDTAAERDRLRALNAELLATLKDLREQVGRNVKMDVKKHYSLMVAENCARKLIDKAEQS